MAGQVLTGFRRLVVKVGSSLLIDSDGLLNRLWLQHLCDDAAELVRDGHEVLIVSSGSIAIGCPVLGINRSRARLEDLQAAAAAGQVQLVHAYQEALRQHEISAAQVLLTPDDTEDRRRFLNARRTLGKLIEGNVIPVINENDTVATEEIRYGDNDRLAARVAQLVMADMLILLSDVDGLYTADPTENSAAKHIPEVDTIGDDIVAIAGDSRSGVGSGGMSTKVQAARIATHAGCATIVTTGAISNPIQALNSGARHSIFKATATPTAVRKQWLAGALDVDGELQVDAGAAQALQGGNSLLPVGVTSTRGSFQRGDVVRVVDQNGVEIGRGLAEYSSTDAARLQGVRSDEIESVLGFRGRSVMIHRDELVIFDRD